MYAVLATGGKQYRVQTGDILRIEKIAGEVGSSVAFDKVLLYSDGENLSIGKPVIENAKVHARVVEQDRGNKIIVFKFKRRKGYRKKQGHRQDYTAVKIDSIEV
jgi:large subunit ribosomal protein L21